MERNATFPPITSQTCDELFAQLTEAKHWFESIGIKTQGNRFATIYSNLDFMRPHWGKPSSDDAARERGCPEITISLLDAGSFVKVHKELAKLKSHQLPRGRIDEALKGPLMPHDEGLDGDTIQARNALFELELAARLQAGGVNLTRFDDIEFDFNEVEVNIQCKRIHSTTKIQDNIDKACDQLVKRIGTSGKLGLVALAIERLSDTDKQLWTVCDESSLLEKSRARVDTFVGDNMWRFRQIVEPRILGVVVCLPFLAQVASRNNLLTRGYEIVILSLCSEEGTPRFCHDKFMDAVGNRIAGVIRDPPKAYR